MSDSFQNYCMVCDCLIAVPQAAALVDTPLSPKRPTGAIRIKNPDGTTTTRTANGVKTTRPAKMVGGAALLAAAAAKAKGLPPPVVETTTPTTQPLQQRPRPRKPKLEIPTPPSPPAFVSTIYCSLDCMVKDAGDTEAEAMKRVASLPPPVCAASPIVAPLSPLLGNSDTDSSASASLAAVAVRASQTPEAASSAPRGFEYFRVRENPEDAWREARDVDRLRRSSGQPPRALEPVVPPGMSRKGSGQGGSAPQSAASGASSDSLSSLWNSDYDSGIQRAAASSKNGGLHAMTPMEAPQPTRRAMSNSDGTTPARPIARSALSHSSLGMLASPSPTPHEVGSAPSHAASLISSYVASFPLRDGGLSGSATPCDARSTSVSITPIPRPCRNRARQNSRTGATWDSFAKSELLDRSRRNTACSDDIAGSLGPPSPLPDSSRGRSGSTSESTPTLQNGGWHLRYCAKDSTSPQSSSSSSRSRSRSREASHRASLGSGSSSIPLPIPERAGSYSSMARRTSSFAPEAAELQSVPSPRRDSVPKPGFDWEARTPHRTYELPRGVVANPNKGLFYFNV